MDLGVDGSHRVLLQRSPFNGTLEPKAPGLLVAAAFLQNGGGPESAQKGL